MVSTINLPDNVKKAIAGASVGKRRMVLANMGAKLNSLFYQNCNSIYSDIINYTSFNVFLASFVLINNDGKNIEYFVDEETLNKNGVLSESEDALFENQIMIKKQDDYIERFDKLRVNIQIDFEKYLTDYFWKEFDKEDK